jgi:hypothetical protein
MTLAPPRAEELPFFDIAFCEVGWFLTRSIETLAGVVPEGLGFLEGAYLLELSYLGVVSSDFAF